MASLLLFGLWAVTACVTSGLLAVGLRMPSLWGTSEIFLEYAAPLPMSWGLLHLPTLLGLGVLVVAGARRPTDWLLPLRYSCVGLLLAVIVVTTLSESLREFPLTLYAGVDAILGLCASFLLAGRAAEAEAGMSPRIRHLLTFGPAVAMLALILGTPLVQSRYKIASSDTRDISPDQDVLRYWTYLRGSPRSVEDECDGLAELADERRRHYVRSDGDRHRALLLFRSREDLWRGEEADAWITYEWWPDGREDCRVRQS